MKKIISLLCFAVFALSASAQHYPNVYVNAGADIALPCGSNCTTLTATYLNSGAATSYVGAPIPAFTPYPDTLGVGPPAPFYISDDVYSGVISIPFPFCFFGNTYRQCVIGNNGMISFDLSYAGQYNPWNLAGSPAIPSPGQPHNAIFGPYMDIIPGLLPIQDSNFVNYATFGTAPNRRFVVSYHSIPFYNTGFCPGDNLTSQIVLYETTNVIEIYIGDKTSCAGWNSGLALEGIQNANGSVGYAVPLRNVTVWQAHNDGYRYTPTGQTNVAVNWYSNGVHLASTDTVTVCPPNNRSTTYIATATYYGCDSLPTVIADSVNVNVLQSAGPVQYLSCPSPAASVNMNGTGNGTWMALSTNPTTTIIANPTSATTLITGFASPGDYGFSWTSGLCADTAHVIVTARANAGPDQNKCKNDTATMNAFGTGTWTPLSGNPSTAVITDPTLNNTTITGFTAGGAYGFIWTTSPGCSDTMLVNIPFFTITPSAGTSTVCQYSNTTVSVTAAPAGLGPFQYVWLDSQKVQSPYTSGTLINAVPGSTYYRIQVTSADGCKLTDSVLVTTSSLIGTNIRASGSPTTVCPGNPVQLVVLANPNGCGLAASPCTAPGTIVSAGTGTTIQNGAGLIYPAPYGNYYKSAHHQFLVRASELLSQVASGGQIKSLTLDVGTLNSGSPLSNFTIKLACVGADSLNGFLALGSLVQVYSAATYTPVNGLNTHTFATPYDWDGQSNLVVDICFTNSTNGNNNPKMRYTTTPFRSIWCTYGNDPGGMCGIIGTQPGNNPTTTARLYQRPNMRFNMCITDLTGANLQWTPGGPPTGAVPANSDTAISHPLTTTTYQVALTSGNGCINYDYVTINVDTSTRLTFNNDTFVCSVQPIQLTASVTGAAVNLANITYTWTANGTIVSTGTGPGFATLNVTPAVTTLYTILTTGGGGCPLFDSMRVTLGNGLPVNKVVDSITCAGANNGEININMNAGVAPFTYTWTPPVSGNIDSAINLGPGTYVVQVTDVQGCSGRDTTTLVAPAPLTLRLDSTNILCFGNNNGTVTATVGGGRPPYTYIWTPASAGTTNLTGLGAGTYTLDVTDASGCTISGTVHVTQPTQVASSAIATSLSGAGTHDGTITVAASGGTPGYTYVSVPSISGLPNATGLDTGIYIITVCDVNNCCVLDTAHVTGPPPIQVVATITNNQCYGQCNGEISVTAAGGVGPYTFQWNTIPVTNSDTARNLCSGSYTVTVTDANSISVSVTYPVTSPPAIGDRIDSTLITCFGANDGALNDSAYGGTPPYTIAWTPGGSNPLSALGPGTYDVLVTDFNGCTFTDQASLGQPPLLAAVVDSTYPARCFGNADGRARITVSGGTPPYTITWTGSSSTSVIANDLNSGAHTANITDAHGCTTSVTANISEPAQLTATAAPTSAHCATSGDGSATAAANGGTPPYLYAWDNVPGAVTANNLAAGPHTLLVTDASGCIATTPFVVDTQYVLHLAMTSTPTSCFDGDDGTATVTTLNGGAVATYLWSDNSAVNPAIGLTPGYAAVTVTDIYGCIANDSVLVDEPAELVAVPYFANPTCTGDRNGKIWLTAFGGTPPYTFTQDSAATVYQITDTITGLGGGGVQIFVKDSKGCVQPVLVTLLDPRELLVYLDTTSITCANAVDGTITAHAVGGTGPYTYIWTPQAPPSINDSVNTGLGPRTYTVRVYDALGCNRPSSVTLVAPPPIVFTYVQVDSTSCPDASDGHILIDVAGGTPGIDPTYTYAINGQPVQSDSNFYNLPAGHYNVVIKDSRGCELDTAVDIASPPLVTVVVDPMDTTLPLGGNIQLNAIVSNPGGQNINAYSWSPASGLSCADCPAPVATPYQVQNYTVVVNYGRNCNASASTTVRVDHGPDSYIPNAFSPNGDGTNDRFEVFGTGLKSVTMRIFNRWGEKVFDSGTDQWASWDGMYKDVAQPTGVYTYVVELVYLDGKKKTREGSITLIR